MFLRRDHLNNFLYSPLSGANSSSPLGAGGLRVGIIGGAGYTGGELIRILINHPNVQISFINSKSNAGKPVASVHADLLGETDIAFSSELSNDIDVLFLCVGHGDAKKFLAEEAPSLKGVKLIDLSQDFRVAANANFEERSFVYGLPELNKEQIKSAENIANPGCFASAIQLGLLPLAKAGLLKEIYTTGITGSTGAGQSLSATTHFSWRANNISAYKTLTHQHLKEITQSLQQLQGSFSTSSETKSGLYFVPWRGDFPRGIYISSTIDCNLSLNEVNQLYKDFYQHEPFTHVSETMIDLKQVVNTNKCLIHIEKAEEKIVVHSAIDNLLKGASGQAVQNMNLMFGLEETAGLRLKGGGF
ncbi:N-acetyl-gamma-glutamyl-phosphate reductase [Segetibacter aerophilus]|uniref:N-acetyl-gamma-glutamyl-phosphate reductase n=1 Tax=Segetibacter aerophilus TaxID=670293 RepID=A0A512BCL2_9BACT|nr:N-acetyl-gamma-glutamyl-phosphate reductase [Segetibacter aerophilus]GEO09688.1 N-acetyl-gamma-glutamyl-phosphate reductase [Segetibacter aerophilus]